MSLDLIVYNDSDREGFIRELQTEIDRLKMLREEATDRIYSAPIDDPEMLALYEHRRQLDTELRAATKRINRAPWPGARYARHPTEWRKAP